MKPIKNRVLLISGSSGVGKGTIVKRLMSKYSDHMALSVSATTRKPRTTEKHGVEYYFHSKDEFLDHIKNDHLLEWVQFDDHYYGTKKSMLAEIFGKGRIPLLETEIQGAVSARKNNYQGLYLYIKPPSFNALEQRIRERGQNTEESIKKRVEKAKQQLIEFETHKHHFDHEVINDNLDDCVDLIDRLIKDKLFTHDPSLKNSENIVQSVLKSSINAPN